PHIIDWLVDAVPRRSRGSGLLRSLRIDFVREALEGDLLDLASCSGSSKDPLYLSEAKRGNETIARAETVWAP
ncbi:MAG: hypothetical protein WCL50_17700, partial [Spirochaetota bacterium]